MCCLWCGFWFMFYIDLFFRTLTQKFFVSHGIHGNAVASPAFTIFYLFLDMKTRVQKNLLQIVQIFTNNYKTK